MLSLLAGISLFCMYGSSYEASLGRNELKLHILSDTKTEVFDSNKLNPTLSLLQSKKAKLRFETWLSTTTCCWSEAETRTERHRLGEPCAPSVSWLSGRVPEFRPRPPESGRRETHDGGHLWGNRLQTDADVTGLGLSLVQEFQQFPLGLLDFLPCLVQVTCTVSEPQLVIVTSLVQVTCTVSESQLLPSQLYLLLYQLRRS